MIQVVLRISAEKRFPRHVGRSAVVLGFTQERFLRVRWSGTRWPQVWHPSLFDWNYAKVAE